MFSHLEAFPKFDKTSPKKKIPIGQEFSWAGGMIWGGEAAEREIKKTGRFFFRICRLWLLKLCGKLCQALQKAMWS
jgi:hypothetical protein